MPNFTYIVMKYLLLPKHFRTAGWFLLIPGLLAGFSNYIFNTEPEFLNVTMFAIANAGFYQTTYFTLIETNIWQELISLMIIMGGIFIGFSRTDIEDEYIQKIRLEALTWAVYVNYLILILAIIFLYGFTFTDVLVFNMFTILLIFVARFEWVLVNLNRETDNE